MRPSADLDLVFKPALVFRLRGFSFDTRRFCNRSGCRRNFVGMINVKYQDANVRYKCGRKFQNVNCPELNSTNFAAAFNQH